MKRRRETVPIVVAGVVVVLVAITVAFQAVTNRNREAALARLKKPPAIARYEKIHGPLALYASKLSAPPSDAPKTMPAPQTIAAYAQMFDQLNAWRTSKWWGQAGNDLDRRPMEEWTPEDWAWLTAAIEEAKDLVAEIRRVAKMGGPAYELDYARGAAIELPHLAKLRDAARLLQSASLVQARQGNLEEAVENVVATMELGNAVAEEPILISQLVRIAIAGIASGTVQTAFPPGVLSPELTQTLIEAAARDDYRDSFAQGLAGEAFLGMQGFERVRGGDSGALAPEGSESRPEERAGLWVYGSAIARPWLNMDERAYADIMGRMSELAQLPCFEADPAMKEIDQEIQDLPRTRVLSRIILPALTRAVDAQARHEAILDITQLGLAIEQYHVQHGAFPAALDAVAPMLGGSVPVDVFTGAPYLYRPSESGFVLYSVGQNRVDDGGRMNYKDGDIVWRGKGEEKKRK